MQQNIFDQFDEPKSKVIPGTVGAKPTEAQARAMGFYDRMVMANSYMTGVEEAGFDPVNMEDVAKDNLPFIPEFFERMMQSTKYKLYKTARMNFSTAQLRRETGAVINDSEIVWIDETYFPQLGEGKEVQEFKAMQRELAIKAMKREAASYYDFGDDVESPEFLEQEMKFGLLGGRRRALKLLKERLASPVFQRPENKALYERTERIAQELAQLISDDEQL